MSIWHMQPISSIWRPLAFLPVTLSAPSYTSHHGVPCEWSGGACLGQVWAVLAPTHQLPVIAIKIERIMRKGKWEERKKEEEEAQQQESHTNMQSSLREVALKTGCVCVEPVFLTPSIKLLFQACVAHSTLPAQSPNLAFRRWPWFPLWKENRSHKRRNTSPYCHHNYTGSSLSW